MQGVRPAARANNTMFRPPPGHRLRHCPSG
jgi:hypothetical protein